MIFDRRLPREALGFLSALMERTPRPGQFGASVGEVVDTLEHFSELEQDQEAALAWFLETTGDGEDVLAMMGCTTPTLRALYVNSLIRIGIMQALRVLKVSDERRAEMWLASRAHTAGRCRCGTLYQTPFPPARKRRERITCVVCGRKFLARVVRPEVN